MIGKLLLSSRSFYKIKSNNDKIVNGRKCNILSENKNDLLVQTNKEFSTKDIYIKLNDNNKIDQILGYVGEFQDDLDIFHYLYTIDWMSNSRYKKLWEEMGFDPTYDLKDRLNYTNEVITIDPEGSIDLDDGFSFSSDKSNYYLDIHIADPISYFNFKNPLMIQIFIELIKRVNTCYIPNSKGSNQPVHLLPEHVVNYISLLETTKEISKRRAITFLFTINKFSNEISYKVEYTLLSNIINKTYEKFDQELNENNKYKEEVVSLINHLIKLIDLQYKPIMYYENISHRMIEIFMILVNYYSGNYMSNKVNKLIIRYQDKKDLPENFEKIPHYCLNFLNYSANYKIISNNERKEHYSLNIYNYCHVSSPMRRVIDMLNHLLMIDNFDFNIEQFISDNIDFDLINNKIKKQRKISNAYELVKILNINNKFKACVLDINKKDNNTFGLLVLFAIINIDGINTEYKKMVNIEIPKTHECIKRFQEFDIELHYNSINFKNNNFPFSIKIL